MFIPFEKLAPNSRIWIYQSEREFTQPEKSFIESGLKAFVDSWVSHANEVNGSFYIFYDRFIVIASDEATSEVSGCSIDKSVHFISSLGLQLNMNLIDRKIAYLNDENGVEAVDVKKFKELINNESIHPQTLIFDNTVSSKLSFETHWLIPAEKSWAGKYFMVKS